MALDLPESDHRHQLVDAGRPAQRWRAPWACRAVTSTGVVVRPLAASGDQLSGTGNTEPRQWFVPPATYDRSVELLHETRHTDALLFTGRRLLGELEGLLRGSGRAVQCLHFTLGHAPGRSDSAFDLGTRCARCRTSRPVAGLLRERLVTPAAAVAARGGSRSAATPLDGRQPVLTELWPGPAEAAERGALLYRLRALEDAVRSLRVVADHRPEAAWQAVTVGSDEPPARPRHAVAAPPCRGLRPLWLLPEPAPLADIRDWQEERGPERIEGGWWQSPVARDYYVLKDSSGRRLWAYRSPAWAGFLAHGWFAEQAWRPRPRRWS
jgi:protein ImuB